MSWRSLTQDHVRLTPAETAALEAIQDSSARRAEIVTTVIGEFRDTIATAGTALDETDDTTLPDMARAHAINRIRWQWLIEFPQLKVFQTKERSEANTAAETFLGKVASGEIAVPPGDGSEADQTPSPSIRRKCHDFSKRDQDGL